MLLRLSILLVVLLAGSRVLAQDVGVGSAPPAGENEPEASVPRGKTRQFAPFYRLGLDAGGVLPNTSYVNGDNPTGKKIRAYKAARFEVGFESTGERPWQEIWNYPSFGLGLYGLDFQDKDDLLGSPGAVYGFALLPIMRRPDYRLDFSTAFGLSGGWKPFDPLDNPGNIALGDFRAAYIETGILYTYYLSKHFDLTPGVTWTHFSNGGTRQPNRGINMVGARLLVGYQPHRPEARTRAEIPAYEQDSEWLVAGSWGERDVLIRGEDLEGDRDPGFAFLHRSFMVYTVTSTYLVQPTHKFKYGGGLDLVFDLHQGTQIDLGDGGGFHDVSLPYEDDLRVGVYGAVEYVIYRMSLLFNLGYSLVQDVDQLPRTYQRFGGKYHFGNHYLVGMNLRFQDFKKSTHLELNFGYRGKIRKRSDRP